MRPTEPQPRFAICVKNKDYPASLELRKLYRVVADPAAAKHHQLRVIDESGEDYLYPENILSLSNCRMANSPTKREHQGSQDSKRR
jgi:hypothetical protein